MGDFVFTSESVTEGHPDKLCDRISDAVLDEVLSHDPKGRVACECFVKGSLVIVGGEITTSHQFDLEGVVREAILSVGYDAPEKGMDGRSCGILSLLSRQSPDIAQGVEQSYEVRNGSPDPLDRLGAGDQGIMFGYACRETEVALETERPILMPLPIFLAHRLARRLAWVRKQGLLTYLRPDGKTQVCVRYEQGRPVEVNRVLISAQHDESVGEVEKMWEPILELVVLPSIPDRLRPQGGFGRENLLINPTGRFVVGGPQADSGLTGRKVIMDTYGGTSRHGGGAFSGKDPTKVDRSATYYCRYVAKNLVAAGVADRLELQVSYAIGRAKPFSIHVETFGTQRVGVERIEQMLMEGGIFDFRPAAMIEELGLTQVRYAPISAYGHLGREDMELPWERLDKVEEVQQALNIRASVAGA